MAGFIDYDAIAAAVRAGQRISSQFCKTNVNNSAVATPFHSFWNSTGLPAGGSNPAATPGTAYVNGVGGITLPDLSPLQKHLVQLTGSLRFASANSTTCVLMVYDRLVGVSGISTATTGDKTVNSTALPRYTDGIGVQVWLENTFSVSSNPVVSMASYTDDTGSGKVGPTYAIPGSANVDGFFGPLPIAAGSKGVKSVETINVVSGTNGTVNVILLKPLAVLPIHCDFPNGRDFVLQLASLERIYDGATLAFAVKHTVNNAISTIIGSLVCAYN